MSRCSEPRTSSTGLFPEAIGYVAAPGDIIAMVALIKCVRRSRVKTVEPSSTDANTSPASYPRKSRLNLELQLSWMRLASF